MAILSKLFRTEQKSCPPTGNPVDIIQSIIEGHTNGASFHSRAYQTNPVVRRAVDLRSMAVGTPEIVLTDTDGTPIEDRNHPLLKLLKHPNPYQSGRQFIHDIEHQLALHGGAYILVSRTGNTINDLRVIPAERVTPQQSTNYLTPIAFFDLNLGNENRRVLPSDMIFIHGTLDEDGITPVSPIDACADPIRTFSEAEDWNRNLLNNGGKPMSVVTIPDKLNAQTYQEFAARYRATMQGTNNAGSTAILDGGKQLSVVGMSAVDLDYNNGLNQITMYICMALGVSPEVVGSSVNACYNTVSESMTSFVTKTVVPELELIYDTLTAYLCKPYPEIIITYDREQLEGINVRPTINEVMTASTILTVNELRGKLSYPPVDGGDVILTSMSSVPLSEVLDPPEPNEDFDDGDL